MTVTGTNQGDRQASVRAVTGTTWTYEGDWHALFTQAGVAAGDFDGRLLAWINARLSTAYTELNGAMYAFAANQGAKSWSEMGTFDASGVPAGTSVLLMADGTSKVLETDATSKILLAASVASLALLGGGYLTLLSSGNLNLLVG